MLEKSFPSRRPASGGVVELREPQAVRGERIKIRRLQIRMPGAAEMIPAQLVGHHEQDVPHRHDACPTGLLRRA